MVELTSDPLELRHAATDRATIVVVPERRLFAIDGVGEPQSGAFALASETLRDADRMLRSRLHRATRVELPPQVLECAWWRHPEVPGPRAAEAFTDRSTWHWQQMMEIPRQASDQDIEAVIDEVRQRAGRAVPLLHAITVAEGRSAQILHVGGAEDQHLAVRALYEMVEAAGHRAHGHLHEIRLADHERVPPGRGRTILRLPIEG
jgi:hypothetical protein